MNKGIMLQDKVAVVTGAGRGIGGSREVPHAASWTV